MGKSINELALDLARAEGAVAGLETALRIIDDEGRVSTDAYNELTCAIEGAKETHRRAHSAWESACIDDAIANQHKPEASRG